MSVETPAANPLFEPSPLPHGLPPFGLIRDDHYREAFDRGMAEHLSEVEAIAANPEPPTFENTLVALERSGQVLSRARLAFFGTSSSLATDAVQAIEEEYAPRLTAHEDAVRLDPRLYARIRAVHDDEAAMAALDPESRRLVERHHTEMSVAGAGLDESAKERLRELNGRLASLGTQFEKRLLADSNDLAVLVDDVAQLDGLTAGEISAAAAAAADHGHDGAWLLTLVLPTGHPHLASITDRDLRRR